MALNTGRRFPLLLMATQSACMSINRAVVSSALISKSILMSRCPDGTRRSVVFPSVYVALAVVTVIRILE